MRTSTLKVTGLTKTYFDLIELIDQQATVIQSQSQSIVQLLNDNAEQENMINEMMRERTK